MRKKVAKYAKPKVSQPKPEQTKTVTIHKPEKPIRPEKPIKPITPVNQAEPSKPQKPKQTGKTTTIK